MRIIATVKPFADPSDQRSFELHLSSDEIVDICAALMFAGEESADEETGLRITELATQVWNVLN